MLALSSPVAITMEVNQLRRTLKDLEERANSLRGYL
jgi:hypothetical protein